MRTCRVHNGSLLLSHRQGEQSYYLFVSLFITAPDSCQSEGETLQEPVTDTGMSGQGEQSNAPGISLQNEQYMRIKAAKRKGRTQYESTYRSIRKERKESSTLSAENRLHEKITENREASASMVNNVNSDIIFMEEVEDKNNG